MGQACGFGFHGRILDVDLSSGRISVNELPSSLCRDYLGGRGMAARLFVDNIQPDCDPLGADNVLVLAASPLIGSRSPTGCRGHLVFKSPLTGGLGSSNCGGTWAPIFKAAGYDVLLIRGQASEPVMIDVGFAGVEIKSASHLWGADVPTTTESLTEGKRGGSKPRVLCIGPAGENLVRFAAVMNDRDRAYGRSGPGAVFGSKKLKAVRVTGSRTITIKNEARFQSGLEQAQYLIKAVPATKRLLRELGTAGLVELINVIDMLPHRNFQDTRHRDEDVDRVSGETLSRTLLRKAGACYGCPIACQRHTQVGDKTGEGPEYETDVMMGPNCDIYDLEAVTRANYLCNELGMDTISFGGTVACAMELFERGALDAQLTDGMELSFGRADVLEELAEKTARRKGFGDLMAEGSLSLARRCGRPDLSMTVKGQEIPAYDPRASYTQALGYMTSPTGACHLRGGYAVSLAFFGGTKEIPRFSLLQSPLSIRNMQNLGILQDSLGVCRFTGFAFGLDPWARMASGITGLPFSTEKLEDLANRVAALERLFNLEAGWTVADDTLPERFFKETVRVAGQDRLIPEEAAVRMREDYYEVRGWDDRGVPLPETCGTLGL